MRDHPSAHEARAAAAVVHVLQAALFICVGRARGFFSCGTRKVQPAFRIYNFMFAGKFLLVSLVPVIGLGVWCFGRKKQPSKEEVGMHVCRSSLQPKFIRHALRLSVSINPCLQSLVQVQNDRTLLL